MLTEETTPLEPGVVDHKYYVQGIGTVKEQQVAGAPPGQGEVDPLVSFAPALVPTPPRRHSRTSHARPGPAFSHARVVRDELRACCSAWRRSTLALASWIDRGSPKAPDQAAARRVHGKDRQCCRCASAWRRLVGHALRRFVEEDIFHRRCWLPPSTRSRRRSSLSRSGSGRSAPATGRSAPAVLMLCAFAGRLSSSPGSGRCRLDGLLIALLTSLPLLSLPQPDTATPAPTPNTAIPSTDAATAAPPFGGGEPAGLLFHGLFSFSQSRLTPIRFLTDSIDGGPRCR